VRKKQERENSADLFFVELKKEGNERNEIKQENQTTQQKKEITTTSQPPSLYRVGYLPEVKSHFFFFSCSHENKRSQHFAQIKIK